MEAADKIECGICHKQISECPCPPSTCAACTREFIPELMKVHKTMCGNMSETCGFCEQKYFVRDRPVHRRNCVPYQDHCADRLLSAQALEHWRPADDSLRRSFNPDLVLEYVRDLIARMDLAALELRQRKQALFYLRRRAQKNRFVVPDFGAADGIPPTFALTDFPAIPALLSPLPPLIFSGSEVPPPANTCTAVVPYVANGPANPPPAVPPTAPPPAQVKPIATTATSTTAIAGGTVEPKQMQNTCSSDLAVNMPGSETEGKAGVREG